MEQFITRIRTNLNGVLEMTQMFNGLMMTGDNLANRIIVELNRDGVRVPITNESRIIGYIIRSDGYTLDIPGTIIEDGNACVDIPAIAYLVSGQLSIAVRMITGEVKAVIATATCYVNVTQTEAIIDTSHRIPDVEDLLQYIADLDERLAEVNVSESLRVTAENQRFLNEQERVSNETARETAEMARDTAETLRAQDEAARNSAETSRGQNENTRINAETLRNTAETQRIQNEQARVAAENQRIANNEAFTTAENARAAAETIRISNENTRISNETARQNAIQNMSVEAVELSPYSTPTVTITDVNGHKHITFGMTPGNPFVIRRAFASIAEMQAYSGTDVKVYDFVIIESNVQDPDNAKLYMKDENGWHFITDLSGSQGIQGPQGIQGETGNGIASAVLNNDYTLTITYTNGTFYTTNSIRGETGNGIDSVTLNVDYTLTIRYTDGNSATTTSIRGETGNGIDHAVLNADYTLTIYYTDGTAYTTDPIRGEKGDTAPGISSVRVNNDYTMTVFLENGTNYTTPFSMRGEKGEPGYGGAEFSYDTLSEKLTVTFGSSD